MPLTTDASFLQSVVLRAQTHLDFVKGDHRYTYPNQVNFLRTLQLVREKISVGTNQVLLSDTTLFSVASLATHAHIYGENKSARQHLDASRKIVDLRGGLNALGQTKLQLEVLRLATGIAHMLTLRPMLIDFAQMRYRTITAHWFKACIFSRQPRIGTFPTLSA